MTDVDLVFWSSQDRKQREFSLYRRRYHENIGMPINRYPKKRGRSK